MAYYLHRSPWWFHHFETLSNHFLELLVPFFLFLGRRMCIIHGVLQILFQVGCTKVPPLRAPNVSTEENSLPYHFCVSTMAMGRGLSSIISPPTRPLLCPIQSGFQGPLLGFHEPHSGVWLSPGSCPRAATQTLLRHTVAPCTLPVFLNPILKFYVSFYQELG